MSADTFTATPDAARDYEAHHGNDWYDARDETPSLAECDRDEAWMRGKPC